MLTVLTSNMKKNLDMLAEYTPPQLLHQIENYSSEDFSSRDWRRIIYFKGKALCIMRHYKEAEEIAIQCIRDSISEADYYILVKCYILQAKTYIGSDSEYQIEPLLNMAIDYSMESGDYELMIDSYQAYMIFFKHNSNFDLALKQEVMIIDLLKRVKPCYTSANALGALAILNVALAKWDIAIKYYLQALEQAQEQGLDLYQLILLNNLGSAMSKINKYDEAEKILKRGLAFAEEMGERHKVFLFTSNIASLKIQEGKLEKAIEYYDKCMSLLENVEKKPPKLLKDLYNNYSLCFCRLKQYEKSLVYVDKAIAIAIDMNDEREQMQLEVNKIELLLELGAYNEALDIAKKGVKYFKKNEDLAQLIWVYRILTQIYYLMKEYKKSYKTEQKLNSITDDYIAEIQTKEIEKDLGKVKVKSILDLEYASTDYVKRKVNTSQGFIGCSTAYHNVLSSAMLAAQYQNTSVMILGESGTGKEIIAQIIHKNSLRKSHSFVPINVGALTSSLVESELFGHTKGAYTGADASTKGFFLQADKGSLFLDEIADMPINVQSKLLRVLETRKVTAVGSSHEMPFDSRLISATSQDIRNQLSDNNFRLDLFHRLNTIEIIIPPLRERKEDIEPILNYYLKYYATELNKRIPYIDRSLLDVIYTYEFPGNVRELKNIIERMYILSKNSDWDAELLCKINPLRFAIDEFSLQADNNEEDAIVKALLKAKGKQKEAALILNMSEPTLSRRIVKYSLQRYTHKKH